MREAKKQVFAIKAGARVKSANPQRLGEELTNIYEEHGKLSAEIYVEEARDEASEMHSTLEWDDSIAGHEHRLSQARSIIRAVVIVNADDNDDPVERNVFVRVDAERGYQPVSIVVENLDMFTEALSSLRKKLNEAINAVNQLQDAAKKTDNPDAEKMAKIALAIQAMHTAEQAIASLH